MLANLVATLRPKPWWQYIGFHLILDIIVIGCIWLVEWPSPENANQQKRSASAMRASPEAG